MALFAVTASAAGATEPEQVVITYRVKTGAHEISGVSHELEWSVGALDEQRAQVRAIVPIDSFDSGHRDFDSALRSAIRSRRHPFAQLDGIAGGDRFDGTLELAGVVRPVAFQLHADRVGEKLIAIASLEIDLREYGVVVAGVDPRMSIDFVGTFTTTSGAVLAGGFNTAR